MKAMTHSTAVMEAAGSAAVELTYRVDANGGVLLTGAVIEMAAEAEAEADEAAVPEVLAGERAAPKVTTATICFSPQTVVPSHEPAELDELTERLLLASKELAATPVDDTEEVARLQAQVQRILQAQFMASG